MGRPTLGFSDMTEYGSNRTLAPCPSHEVQGAPAAAETAGHHIDGYKRNRTRHAP